MIQPHPPLLFREPLPLIPRPAVLTLNLRLRLISGSTGAADVPSIIDDGWGCFLSDCSNVAQNAEKSI